MQTSTTAKPRQGFTADGKDSKVSVGKIANGAVNGKVAAKGHDCGKPMGSAIKGFSGTGIKSGKV